MLVFKIICKLNLSRPQKGPTFLLRQFVTYCDMLDAIFLDILNGQKIATLHTSLAFKIGVLERPGSVNFSQLQYLDLHKKGFTLHHYFHDFFMKN